ncbi:MAG: glycosyltransferase family 4 protein [Opitutaceae bacterium]|nr:glycosyltransferase family 4 protein [Opitutaceae bacterium]
MKVAVETSALYTSRAGVARYVRGLLQGLQAVRSADVQVAELGWSVENFGFGQPQRALKTLAREWGWAKCVAPVRLRDVDVLHHTALPIIPFVRRIRHVVTLHDLALVRTPERFRPWQRAAGLRRLRRVGRADKVIAVSRFTADEAMALLGLSAQKIEVVHEAAWPAQAGTPVATQLPPEYFLFVGSLEPGKNLALLRRIYAGAPGGLPPLVVAGARWSGVTHEGPPPPDWHFLGHADDGQLATLYRGAKALLFPSIYEGFGLPVLEAMAYGCPVLCGPVASLPEVGGDAAAYAELTPEAYGAAMQRLATDEGWRNGLREAGLKRAAQFSWEKCARETLAVYRALS